MLCENPELCARLGAQAAEAARGYTWERNGREVTALFEDILRQKGFPTAAELPRDEPSGEVTARK